MKLLSAGLVLVSALTATTAFGQDLISWGEAGGWAVAVDPTLGNGCLLTSDFEDGSTVRIGFDRLAGNGYVAAFNEAWGDIEAGATYPVTFMLDDQQYDGEATGMFLGELPGAVITFDNVDFLADLALRNTMVLSNDGGEIMAIDLAGSDAAIEQTIACQEEQG